MGKEELVRGIVAQGARGLWGGGLCDLGQGDEGAQGIIPSGLETEAPIKIGRLVMFGFHDDGINANLPGAAVGRPGGSENC